jgi:hypothetical protein
MIIDGNEDDFISVVRQSCVSEGRKYVAKKRFNLTLSVVLIFKEKSEIHFKCLRRGTPNQKCSVLVGQAS